MSIRSFISVELPPAIRHSITELVSRLRKAGPDVAWVHADNIHLTLKFLGNADNSLLAKIKDRIGKKLSHFNTFYIKIVGVGCFPSKKRPRVLWVGIESSVALNDLHRSLEAEVAELGFVRDERPYSPHLTIGRIRSRKGVAQMLSRLEEFRTAEFGDMEVNRIHIMKSELKTTGAEYTSIAEIPIGRGRHNVKGVE